MRHGQPCEPVPAGVGYIANAAIHLGGSEPAVAPGPLQQSLKPCCCSPRRNHSRLGLQASASQVLTKPCTIRPSHRRAGTTPFIHYSMTTSIF